jgi:stringent starvation protein B
MVLPSTKPYLLRAIWEWCCDNGFTPYIAVQVDSRTRVPREFINDGQIVLNIGPEATNKFRIDNEFVEFTARFGGVAREIFVPVGQVTAIYSRENGAGMAFDIESEADSVEDEAANMSGADAPVEPPPEPPRPEGGRPKLQRIK